MLTVIRAGAKAGYSSWDHLITGRELQSLAGQTFKTLAALAKAANKLFRREAEHRVGTVPIWAEVQIGNEMTTVTL